MVWDVDEMVNFYTKSIISSLDKTAEMKERKFKAKKYDLPDNVKLKREFGMLFIMSSKWQSRHWKHMKMNINKRQAQNHSVVQNATRNPESSLSGNVILTEDLEPNLSAVQNVTKNLDTSLSNDENVTKEYSNIPNHAVIDDL